MRRNAGYENQGFADLMKLWAGEASLTPGDIDAGRLVVVAPELPMEIRLYRNGERARAVVYDTRGIWLDQPQAKTDIAAEAEPLRRAG